MKGSVGILNVGAGDTKPAPELRAGLPPLPFGRGAARRNGAAQAELARRVAAFESMLDRAFPAKTIA